MGSLAIKPEQMTDEVWEYIMIDGAPLPASTDIAKEKLEKMRAEFQYWYPMDLRCSGKDLIPNHLSFLIYNHVAIFPEAKWPKAIRSNGHLLLNSEKMSKSTGNFMTLQDAVEEFGADATRIALADAGDFSDDANFLVANANAAILRLFTQKEWGEQALQEIADGKLRTGPYNFNDRVFEAEMNRCVGMAEKAYENMMYKEALKYALFEMQGARDWYRDYNLSVDTNMNREDAAVGLHKDLVERFVEWQTLLLTVFAPHWAEYMWRDVLKKVSIDHASSVDMSRGSDENFLVVMAFVPRDIHIHTG
jgi:leucyl-tRNA synthetase